jgi:hypothetical protein
MRTKIKEKEIHCKLEDLKDNIKYWLSQGFMKFTVIFTDYKAKIKFEYKEQK